MGSLKSYSYWIAMGLITIFFIDRFMSYIYLLSNISLQASRLNFVSHYYAKYFFLLKSSFWQMLPLIGANQRFFYLHNRLLRQLIEKYLINQILHFN